jgi:hypothetical protein
MHVFFAVLIGLVVGGILGYAFRGKESKAIASAAADLKSKL